MPPRFILILSLLLLGGCAGSYQHKVELLYDFTVGTTDTSGVCTGILSTPQTIIIPIGCIGSPNGVTWVASRRPLPDSVFVSWRNSLYEDHLVRIPMRTILPPLEPLQKYHITVLIHRGDSISTEVRVLDWADCSHLGARSEAYSGPGPCAY